MTLFVAPVGDFLATQLAPLSPRSYQEVTRKSEWAEPPTIVVSGAQEPGEPGDTCDQERGGGNEVQGENPDTSREIEIPSGQGHAHESSRVTRERPPVARVPAPDVSQKLPRCSTNLSHKTLCYPSPQKQIGTPAQQREPTRTPLLYSRPVTRSHRKTPESAKRKEGGENVVIFLWGSRSTGAPPSP